MRWRVNIGAHIGQLSLDVELQGDANPTVILGPNGSGKTTLLRVIAGAYRPQHGRIIIDDHTLFDADRAIDIAPEQRGVGYVPQGYGLFEHLRVVDNVAFGLSTPARNISRPARRKAAMNMLVELDCAHLGDRFPASLSGGEKQRVALARALLINPQLLLLDEPLAALDASARRALRRFLSQYLIERGMPSIVVTHDVRDVHAFGPRVFVIEHGRIVQSGTIDELKQRPATDFVAEFFDASPFEES